MGDIEVLEREAEADKAYIESRRKPIYDFFKRAFDIIAALFSGIIMLIPILLISGIIIAKDGWSPFYVHGRIGKNGKKIGVVKFRSMKKNADDIENTLNPQQLAEYKTEYKINDDPRLIGYKKSGDGVRCFGGKLRRLSLDELPQIIINILILGNMSIVGPRPIMEEELKENYTPEEQKLLLSVKPGLTGYWQAYARSNAGYSNRKRQKMELFYVRNRSFLLDIKIILKTFTAIIKSDGAK